MTGVSVGVRSVRGTSEWCVAGGERAVKKCGIFVFRTALRQKRELWGIPHRQKTRDCTWC